MLKKFRHQKFFAIDMNQSHSKKTEDNIVAASGDDSRFMKSEFIF